MNKQSIRFIPAAAIAIVMAVGGQAYAQTTTSGPVVTKEAVDPANKAADKSMPKTMQERDERAAAKGKNTTKKATPLATGDASTMPAPTAMPKSAEMRDSNAAAKGKNTTKMPTPLATGDAAGKPGPATATQ
ncbi:MAG: hypothetical protein Q7T87_15270 [Polaromonas sp.]|nr:hypothetical protein [Polaromonas sp.]